MPLQRFSSSLLLVLVLFLRGSALWAQLEPIRITADLTESSRRVFHAEIDLPVHAGPAVFTSPLWIPGSHAPNGPVGGITGLVFTANGKVLPWRRDEVTLAEFHVDIPAGVRSVHAHVDAIVTSRATREMAMLEWDTVMLYPARAPVNAIRIEPAVTFPAGWGIGTALTKIGKESTPRSVLADQAAHLPPADAVTIQYAQTTVEQLEDSPVLVGNHFREYRLAPEVKPAHLLDVAGDTAVDAEFRPEVLRALNNLVREARVEYGTAHYREYHFLVTRSQYAGGYGGLEHAQSTDIGIQRSSMSDEAHQIADADLFAHEFTHSWNGKYRRPTGIYQMDFATPVQARLLWIYEGLTQYLGDVLATRAGLKTQEQFRDMLALTAADLDTQSGRNWRSTEDTAVAASLMRGGGWANWRRGKAYYEEGEVLWLDVDTLLRSLTRNRRSLDDFAQLFLGKGGDTGPAVLPYDLEEVIRDLNDIAPHDWAGFFHDRVATIQRHADVDGIVRGGCAVVYTDHPSATEQYLADPAGSLYAGEDFWYSLGLRVDESGNLMDVRWNSVADAARLSPKQKLLTVNGTPYTVAVLHDAIGAAMVDRKPLRLVLRQDGEDIAADLDYQTGERFPHLACSQADTSLLDLIARPRSR